MSKFEFKILRELKNITLSPFPVIHDDLVLTHSPVFQGSEK
jgi:hypothetical protein